MFGKRKLTSAQEACKSTQHDALFAMRLLDLNGQPIEVDPTNNTKLARVVMNSTGVVPPSLTEATPIRRPDYRDGRTDIIEILLHADTGTPKVTITEEDQAALNRFSIEFAPGYEAVMTGHRLEGESTYPIRDPQDRMLYMHTARHLLGSIVNSPIIQFSPIH